MNTKEELIKLKERTDLSWKKLSEYYGIPYRTVQDWYTGRRNMPEYLLRLMIYKANIELVKQDRKQDLSIFFGLLNGIPDGLALQRELRDEWE